MPVYEGIEQLELFRQEEFRRREVILERLRGIRIPTNLAVVIPAYNEIERMDALESKVQELIALKKTNELFRMTLVVVDEGSADGTFERLTNIAKEHPEVIALQIDPTLKQQKIEDRYSVRMGGAMLTGYRHAIKLLERKQNAWIGYTDFDSSVPLWQVVEAYKCASSIGIALGSRRRTDSLVLRASTMLAQGSYFINKWKKMFPLLGEMTDDTNGPLQLWRADIIKDIVVWAESQKLYSVALKTAMLAKAALAGRKIQTFGLIFNDMLPGTHFPAEQNQGRIPEYDRQIEVLQKVFNIADAV